MAGSGQTGQAALADDQRVQMMYNILTRKGDAAAGAIKRRIDAGEGIAVQGHSFTLSNLKTAIAKYEKHKSAPGEENTSVNRANSIASEPFEHVVKVTGDKQVAILLTPDALGKTTTGEHLASGQEVEVVQRAMCQKDGRVYLRLKDGRGWVSTRSRKEFSKVVISFAKDAPGQSLEGNSKDVGMEIACAANIKGSPQKKRKTSLNGDLSTAEDQPRNKETYFRVINAPKVAVLKEPNTKLNATAYLDRGAVFAASEVCTSQSDSRVYLRLADHRGWVCVQSRTDWGRAVVQAIQKEEFEEESRTQAGMQDDTSLVQHVKSKLDEGKVNSIKRMATETAHVVNPTQKRKALSIKLDGVGSPSKMSQPAKTRHKLEFDADEAMVFRSDNELWPVGVGTPRPLRPAQRQALRRGYVFFAERAQDAERDMKEAQARANTYKRTCEPQKALLDYVAKLKKESQKLKKDWVEWIEKELAKTDDKTITSLKMDENLDGVAPVQVRGARWFCAVLNDKDKEIEEGTDRSENSQLHFGPLRRTADEAKRDHEQLSSSKKSGAMVVAQPKQSGRPKKEQKEQEDEEAEARPKKRLRVMKDMGEECV